MVAPVVIAAGITAAASLFGGRSARRSAKKNLEFMRELQNFRPIRVRSGIGELFFGPQRIEFTGTPEFKKRQQESLDFFGNISREAADFSTQGATESALQQLRTLRAPQTASQLGRLESRLIGQGRLGLSGGPRDTNPELESFFASARDADIKESLFALGEGRAQRSSLIDALRGSSDFAQSLQLPMGMFGPAQSLFSGLTARAGGVGQAAGSFFRTSADASRGNIESLAGLFKEFLKSRQQDPTETTPENKEVFI